MSDLESFLKHYERINAAPTTIQNYQRSVLKFLQVCPDYATAPRRQIREAVETVIEPLKSPDSKNFHIRNLSVFFKYLRDELQVREDFPLDKFPMRKLPKRLPKDFDDRTVELMYRENDKTWTTIRNTAMVAVFISTGLRLAEIISLNTDDVQGDTIRVMGKGSKEREVYLTPEARKYLDRYLKVRKSPTTILFVTGNNTRLSDKNVGEMIRDRSIGRMSPHDLRRYFATKMHKRGVPIEALRIMMGHSSIVITQKYLNLTNKDVKKEFFKE